MKLENSPIDYQITRQGQEPWLCFLHAAFVNHGMFRQQVDFFRDQYNILTVDIIGHGSSTQTRKGDSILDMTRWLLEILDAQQIPQVHLVGVSLGAVLAQDFANHHPDRTASLACFGGYDINNFDPGMQKENGAAQMGMMLKGLFSVKWFAQANKLLYACNEKAQQDAYEMNLLFPKKSFMYLAGMEKMVNCHETGVRPYPLLIGCGDKDIPMELEVIRQWQLREPDCQAVVFENAGHCVNMDVPERFNSVMDAFWKQS